MSTTFTRNAKLKITDGMTADAIYNLQRIDSLLDPQNTRGGVVRLGDGAPNVLSNDMEGDVYIDLLTKNLYRLTGGAWVLEITL